MYTVTEQYSQNIAKAVRTTAVSGFIKTKRGEILTINDSSIKMGSLSISSRLNSSGDFKPGGVYSSELSVTLLGIAAYSLDGARITLDFLLYRGNSEEYDSVPLGTFYVDGSTIKRRGTAVSLKADDALMNFDYPAEAISGSLYELAVTACVKCDVPLRTSTEEFAALPNADITAEVNISRVQTWRDLLIFIAMLTGTFVRIDRTGGLRFVPLTCERNSGGVIIPVREIAGNIRSSTEFSDDTTRVTRLFMRRGGGVISAEKNYSESSEKYVALELLENPLLNGLSDSDAETALGNTLSALSVCLNRAYKSDFNGDPALDTGDYVRLRGGAVDTSRGYATGMITSQVWRYRGKHTIQCSLSSSIPPEESVQTFSLRVADDTVGTVSKMRVQPKSQLEKELDGLRGKTGTGGVGKAAESDPTSEYFNDYTGNAITGKYPYPYPNSPYEKGYNSVEGHKNTLLDSYGTHVEGAGNTVSRVIDSHIGGDGNTVEGGYCLLIQGNNNAVHRWEDTDGSRHLLLMGDGNKVGVSGNANFSIVNGINCYLNNTEFAIVLGNENRISKLLYGLILGQLNEINSDYTFAFGKGLKTNGNGSVNNFQIMLGQYNAVAKQIKPKSTMSYGYNILFSLGAGSGSSASRRSTALIIDEVGNIYCNKVYELGSKITSDMVTEKGIIDASSLINQSSIATASAVRTISAAASTGMPIVLLDHTPTADDLTGSECVFLQCDDTASVKGESTGIFRVTDIFAEKSLQ